MKKRVIWCKNSIESLEIKNKKEIDRQERERIQYLKQKPRIGIFYVKLKLGKLLFLVNMKKRVHKLIKKVIKCLYKK